MKHKKPVAKNKTPKVRGPSLQERISAIEALPDVDALAKRIDVLENDVLKKTILQSQTNAALQAFILAEVEVRLKALDALRNRVIALECPSPLLLDIEKKPAPIAPHCPHGLARGFFAMGEPRQCIYAMTHLSGSGAFHNDGDGHRWPTGDKWDRILVNGVWTRP